MKSTKGMPEIYISPLFSMGTINTFKQQGIEISPQYPVLVFGKLRIIGIFHLINFFAQLFK